MMRGEMQYIWSKKLKQKRKIRLRNGKRLTEWGRNWFQRQGEAYRKERETFYAVL